MSDSRGGHPIQLAVFVLLLVGGGWYFLRNYEIDGLDEISVYPKSGLDDATSYSGYDAPVISGSGGMFVSTESPSNGSDNPFQRLGKRRAAPVQAAQSPRKFRPLRVGSWALDGFGPTKLANDLARTNITRIVRQFDVIALQQIASLERDLVPRLVEAINQGDHRFDYVLGESTGPENRQEQLAFVFDKTRIVVDRRQTYTVDDPSEQMTYDPLVAWFRAAEPNPSQAWTFSMVNVRIELANAPKEVALLPEIVSAIRNDGRREDDIVVSGLFQADDAYLIPTIDANFTQAVVRARPTDIFGKYQTSNLLFDSKNTTEYFGRGGVDDYLRRFKLNVAEAETVSSHLPVFGEFSAVEGGQL